MKNKMQARVGLYDFNLRAEHGGAKAQCCVFLSTPNDTLPPINKSASAARGNVLFIILIAIGLFAALAATVMNSEGGGKDASEERGGLYADDLLLYANNVEQAVNRMLSRGMSESALCFDDATYPGGNTDYEHAACATVTNRVFHPQGGGIKLEAINPSALDSKHSALTYYGKFLITGKTTVNALNSGSGELIYFVPHIKKSVCLRINEIAGIAPVNGDAPMDDIQAFDETNFYFLGTFGAVRVISSDPSAPATAFNRTMFGCLKNEDWPGPNNYSFYRVLIPR